MHQAIKQPSGPPFFNQNDVILILAWKSNYIHYKVWDEITYPFPNVNSATTLYWTCDYLSMLGLKIMPCYQKGSQLWYKITYFAHRILNWKTAPLLNWQHSDRFPWWRPDINTISALLAFCEWNPSVTGDSTHNGPMMWSIDVFFIYIYICLYTFIYIYIANLGKLLKPTVELRVIWDAMKLKWRHPKAATTDVDV